MIYAFYSLNILILIQMEFLYIKKCFFYKWTVASFVILFGLNWDDPNKISYIVKISLFLIVKDFIFNFH